MKNFGG